MDEKLALETKAAKTKKKINTARTLISSLTGEKNRWNDGLGLINDEKRRLVGNASLSVAFISYCGPFNAIYRNLLAADYFIADMRKRGVPCEAGFEKKLNNFLADDAIQGEWRL